MLFGETGLVFMTPSLLIILQHNLSNSYRKSQRKHLNYHITKHYRGPDHIYGEVMNL